MSFSGVPVTGNPLVTIMAAKAGVAPIYLLDVLAIDGTSYHWASQPIASAAAAQCPPILTGNPPAWNAAHLHIANWDDVYLPWLINAGPFHLSRSQQSDIGNFVIQNVSGDSLQRDMSTLITSASFEGALFAYREWNTSALAAEFEFRGRLTMVAVTEVQAEFAAEQLFNLSTYEMLDEYSETCRWIYASAACGDVTNNPCQNSYPTCRIPERFAGVLNTYTTDLSPTAANVSSRLVNRRRQV